MDQKCAKTRGWQDKWASHIRIAAASFLGLLKSLHNSDYEYLGSQAKIKTNKTISSWIIFPFLAGLISSWLIDSAVQLRGRVMSLELLVQ
jgi:hypothetical protein